MYRLLFLICFVSSPVFAHSGHLDASSGFSAGFLHPFLGLDHLFAMLCVGITSSRLGGRAIWAVPGLFIGVMTIGFILGKQGIPFAYFESLIGLSLVFFGILLVPTMKLRIGYIVWPIMVFAIAHGYAHGSEIGVLHNPWDFQQGFLLASVIIHICGVMLGFIPTSNPYVQRGVKAGFVAIAVYGIFLI